MAAHTGSTNAACSSKTSKQLLYSEKFEGSLEEKLRIVGRNASKASNSGPKKTFRPPPSSVLGRVQAFLPQLAQANETLSTLPVSEVSLEHVDPDHDGPVIEMNFALMPSLGSDVEESSEDDESDDNNEDNENNADDKSVNGCDAGKVCSSFDKKATQAKVLITENNTDRGSQIT